MASTKTFVLRTGLGVAAILTLFFSCKTPTDSGSAVKADDDATPAASPDEAASPEVAKTQPAVEDGDYQGSRYADVWAAVKSDPYKLPLYKVTMASFANAALEKATKATISDFNDLRPKAAKLIRPNGICLTGTWKMTADSPYTGYFRNGKEALIVARASVGLSITTRGAKRSFGMGGKLFPTTDPQDPAAYKTANFFVIDDNAGTKKGAFVDPKPPMTNAPPFTGDVSFQTVAEAGIILAIKKAQELADVFEGERQLYQIAELGEAPGAEIKTPRYINVFGLSKPKIEMSDFRDELKTKNYDGPIRLAVEVSDVKGGPFTRLGEISFTESVVSDTCDHSLHFHHPKWR